MDFSIASILALDGVTNGAVYALLATATVLLFAVTRVIFIPQGEFVAFGALTLALLQAGKVPGTVWFLLALALAVAVQDVVRGLRHRASTARLARQALATLAYPVAVSLLALWVAPMGLPMLAQAALSVHEPLLALRGAALALAGDAPGAGASRAEAAQTPAWGVRARHPSRGRVSGRPSTTILQGSGPRFAHVRRPLRSSTKTRPLALAPVASASDDVIRRPSFS
jgi:branched-subunit amino acid ABC-type transport system permease component